MGFDLRQKQITQFIVYWVCNSTDERLYLGLFRGDLQRIAATLNNLLKGIVNGNLKTPAF
jgi:hypothetical protein